MTEKQIAALVAGDICGKEWSLEEKVFLEFLDQVIEGPEIEEKTFENARNYFSDQALVEIVTMQVRSRECSMFAILTLPGVLLQPRTNNNCVPCRCRAYNEGGDAADKG